MHLIRPGAYQNRIAKKGSGGASLFCSIYIACGDFYAVYSVPNTDGTMHKTAPAFSYKTDEKIKTGNFQKKLKKVLDNGNMRWYTIKAVARGEALRR